MWLGLKFDLRLLDFAIALPVDLTSEYCNSFFRLSSPPALCRTRRPQIHLVFLSSPIISAFLEMKMGLTASLSLCPALWPQLALLACSSCCNQYRYRGPQTERLRSACRCARVTSPHIKKSGKGTLGLPAIFGWKAASSFVPW